MPTEIEWTDETWNPIRGCSRVSEGCRNCYAEGVARRFSGPGMSYEGLVRTGPDGDRRAQWNGIILFVEQALLKPLRWRRPRMIFVNSMSDLFHENVTDAMLDQIFAVMACCPQHTFQVLTKRPERMREYFMGRWPTRLIPWLQKWQERPKGYGVLLETENGLLPNVWLGVSVENQKAADERIPLLLHTPAAKRFISAEPLLGPVDLQGFIGHTNADCDRTEDDCSCEGPELDWVIFGGESGTGTGIRPMHPDWARSLRDQCAATGTPCFFKQWGAYKNGSDFADDAIAVLNDGRTCDGSAYQLAHLDRESPVGSCNPTMMRRVGKAAAGDLLDGQQYHQFPEAR